MQTSDRAPGVDGDLRADDAAFVWHPFTQAKTADAPPIFTRGEGARLFDDAGRSVLDLISSWWVNVHGHAHPAIASAIAEQARKLEHVHFAGASHAPAIELARELVSRLPSPLQRVFYSDNGSTAVEAALKIALQYHFNRGSRRRRLLAFEGGYHGDTFGAMSVGRGSPFFRPFNAWLLPVDLVRYANVIDGFDPEPGERAALAALDRYLATYGHELAACIVEPLVQGAGGMRMARPEFVREISERVRAVGGLVIYDEVFTGFGRTGTMFACEQVEFTPDLLCLAKGMTGGFLPLAATIATEEIYTAFLDDRSEKAFLHGHSFTANPLGCAAALASLQLFERESTLAKIRLMTKIHRDELAALRQERHVSATRGCGTIAAFELDFSPEDMVRFQKRLFDVDVFIRPLRNIVYLVPPYCLSTDDLRRVYALIKRAIQTIGYQHTNGTATR